MNVEFFGGDKNVLFLPLSYCLYFGDVEMSIITKGRMNASSLRTSI